MPWDRGGRGTNYHRDLDETTWASMPTPCRLGRRIDGAATHILRSMGRSGKGQTQQGPPVRAQRRLPTPRWRSRARSRSQSWVVLGVAAMVADTIVWGVRVVTVLVAGTVGRGRHRQRHHGRNWAVLIAWRSKCRK